MDSNAGVVYFYLEDPPSAVLRFFFSFLLRLSPTVQKYMLFRGDGTSPLDLASSHAPHHSPRLLPWIPEDVFSFRPFTKKFLPFFLGGIFFFMSFFNLLLVFSYAFMHHFNIIALMHFMFFALWISICLPIICTTIATCLYVIAWLLKSFLAM